MAEFDSGGEPVRKRHSEDYVAGGYCSFCLGHSHNASNCPNKPKPDINEIVGEQIKKFTDQTSLINSASYEFHNEQLSAWLAIQDVLGLHRPFAYLDPIDFMVGSVRDLTYLPWCVECSSAANEEDGVGYPCPTRQAITNRVGGK